MKMKLSSDNNLPFSKISNFYNLTIFVRSVFQKDGKYYPQVFLDKLSYEF